MEDTAAGNLHKEHLLGLIDHLDKEGWRVSLQAPGAERPYDCIIVNILSDQDLDQVLWSMELSFLPISSDQLKGVNILQCFIPLANNFGQLHSTGLFELITKINTKLPLVGFGFMDQFSLLYYKHNIMVPHSAEMHLIVSEALAMITYLISTFTCPLIDVATGEKNVAEAIDQMQFRELYN